MSVLGTADVDARERAEWVLYDLRERRGVNLNAPLRHQAAVAAMRSRADLLRTIRTPTLVVHRTADRWLPVEHGRKLAATVAGAKAVWLDGVGDAFPYPDMEAISTRIHAFLENAT